MRRSLFAGIGVAAVLIFAACSPDQTRRDPLAPTDVGLAKGGGSDECAGGVASEIAKNEKLLFAEPGLTALQDQFTLIKNACVIDQSDATERSAMLGYFDLMIENRTETNAAGLAAHLNKVASYAKGTELGVPASVFSDIGGAAVVTVTETARDSLVTFDKGARLLFDAGTDAITTTGTETTWTRLFTFTPLTAEECGDITGLRLNHRGDGAPCFDINDYPDAVEYTPEATLTICMHESAAENDGIVHEKNGYGDEILPPVEDVDFDCTDFHNTPSGLSRWLEKSGGPLGRVLARAYDYLAPKTLFADDVGESGSLGFFSKVGGILNDTFEDDFNDSSSFNPNPKDDRPDLGDTTWIYNAPAPGFIRMQSSIGNLGLVTPGVLVLSQGQGACNNCPVFKLLGEVKTVDEDINQTNEADREINGSFEISWKELQSKPSVKEAPFVLLNNALNNNNNNLANVEIARVSHVTVSSQNKLLIKVFTDEGCPVPGPNPCVRTIDAGTWTQNQSDEFKIILNLATLNPDSAKRVAFFVNGVEKANVKALNATGFKHLGYVLTGIDAGIIGSDDWFVTRRADKP